MNFEQFETWIKRHRYLSIVLIALFCLGAVGQILGYSQKLWDLLTLDGSFEIVRLEISVRNSVYYEWDKLPEKSKHQARKTQFDDRKYRQFRYDEGFVDSFGTRPAKGVVTAFFIAQYAVSRLELPSEVRTRFRYFLRWTPESKHDFKNFLYELVPARRFQYREGTNDLKLFIQGNDSIHRHFLHALQSFHDNPVQFQFTYEGRSISQTTVESLVKEHIALFSGFFLPVFEVYLENNSRKAVTIDKVGVEVIKIAEYRGGAEAVPASNIITIPVAYKPGMNRRVLTGDEQVYLKAGHSARLLLRLEPQDKLSSYLVRLHVYAGEVHQKTNVFALDM